VASLPWVREHPALRALAVPNFRRFFAGDLVSMCGGFLQTITLVWVVLDLGGNAFDVAMLVSLQNLPSLVLAPVGGTLADRFDNRKLLIGLQFVGVAEATTLGVLTATGSITLGWIYVLAIVLGLFVSFSFPAANAMRYEVVEADDLSSAIGLGSTTMSVGRLVGPALAGILLATTDAATCFFVDASTFLFFVLMLLLIRPGELRPRRAADRTSGKLRDGLRYAWERPMLRLVLASVAIVSMLAYNLALMIPAMTRIEFGGSSTAYAVVATTTGLAGLIGGVAAAGIVRPSVRVFGWLGVGFGVPLLASTFSPSVAVFAVFFLGVGFASAAFWAVAQMLLQHGTDPEYQGRVMSLYTVAWGGTTIFGALAMGALIDAVSARAAMAVGGVTTLVVALVLLRWARRHQTRAQTTIGKLPSPRTFDE
jgi:MFS family permease